MDLSIHTSPASASSTSPDDNSNYPSPSSGGMSGTNELHPLDHRRNGTLTQANSMAIPITNEEKSGISYESASPQPWGNSGEYHETAAYHSVGLESHLPSTQQHYSPAQHFTPNPMYDLSGTATSSSSSLDQTNGETSPLEYNVPNTSPELSYSHPISFAAQMDAQQLRMSFDQTYSPPTTLGYSY